ncbi:uncharacterized protein LOC144456596 [Phascolarctos cinereus]
MVGSALGGSSVGMAPITHAPVHGATGSPPGPSPTMGVVVTGLSNRSTVSGGATDESHANRESTEPPKVSEMGSSTGLLTLETPRETGCTETASGSASTQATSFSNPSDSFHTGKSFAETEHSRTLALSSSDPVSTSKVTEIPPISIMTYTGASTIPGMPEAQMRTEPSSFGLLLTTMNKTLPSLGGGPSTPLPSMAGTTESRTVSHSISEPTDPAHTTPGQLTSNKGTLEPPWTDGMTSYHSPSMRQELDYSTTLPIPSASLGTMTLVTMTGEERTDAPSLPPATKGTLYPENGDGLLASTEGFLPTTSTEISPDVASTSTFMAEPSSAGSPQISESSKDPYGSLYAPEITVGQVTSQTGGPSTDSPVDTTSGHSSGVSTTSLGAETSSHLVTVTLAEAFPDGAPVSSRDEAPISPWFSTPAEAARRVLSTGLSWLWTPTPATPEASSGSPLMVDGISSAVPGTEGTNLTPSSKIMDILPISPTSAQHSESPVLGRGASPTASMTTSLPLRSTSSDTGTGVPGSSSTAVSSSWEGSRDHEVLSSGSETNPIVSLTTSIVEDSTRDISAPVTGEVSIGRLSQEPSTSLGEIPASSEDTAPTGMSPISQQVSPARSTELSPGVTPVAGPSILPASDLPTKSALSPGTLEEARSASAPSPGTWLSPSSISPMSTSENNGASPPRTTSSSPTELMPDVSTSVPASDSNNVVSTFSEKTSMETDSSSAAPPRSRLPGFIGSVTVTGAPWSAEETIPQGPQLATTSGSGLTLSPPLTETPLSITTDAGSWTTSSTSVSSQAMAADTSIPMLLGSTSAGATSLASIPSSEAGSPGLSRPSPDSSALFIQSSAWTSTSAPGMAPSSGSTLFFPTTTGSEESTEDRATGPFAPSSMDVESSWTSAPSHSGSTLQADLTSSGISQSLGPSSQSVDLPSQEGTGSPASESKVPTTTVTASDTGLSSGSPMAAGPRDPSPASREATEPTSLPVVASTMGTSTFRRAAVSIPLHTAPGSAPAQSTSLPVGSASGSQGLETPMTTMSSVAGARTSTDSSAGVTTATGSLPLAATSAEVQEGPGSSAPLDSNSLGAISSTATPSAALTTGRDPDTKPAETPAGDSFHTRISASGPTSSQTLALSSADPGSTSKVTETPPISIITHTVASTTLEKSEAQTGTEPSSSGLPLTSLSKTFSPEEGGTATAMPSTERSTGPVTLAPPPLCPQTSLWLVASPSHGGTLWRPQPLSVLRLRINESLVPTWSIPSSASPVSTPGPESGPLLSMPTISTAGIDDTVATVTHIPDQGVYGRPRASTSDSQASGSTVGPMGKEADVVPITQIPDRGAPRGPAALTIGPPECIDTLCPTVQEANHSTPPMTGAWTSQTAPPATEPTETSQPEAVTSSVEAVTADATFPPSASPGAILDFITHDNRQLAPGKPYWRVQHRSNGYATLLHHTLLTTGSRLGAETVLSPVTTVAYDSFTSSSSVSPTEERTDSSTSSTTSEATSLTMTWRGSTSAWPNILSSSPPAASSGIVHMPKDISSAAPTAESTSPSQSPKVIEIVPPFLGTTHSHDPPKTVAESSTRGLPTTSSSPQSPMSSATTTGGPVLLATSSGSTPREMMTHDIPPEDLEVTSDLSLATLDMAAMVSTVTATVTEEMSSVPPRSNTDTQVSSDLPPSTSSSKALHEQSTFISQPSTTAKSMDLTTPGADIIATWPQTLSPSTSVALSGVTPMTDDVGLVAPGTESLIESNEPTDIAPLSMTTDSPELPSIGAESSTGAPLTTASPQSPMSLVAVTGPLSTSADSTSPETMAYGVPRTDTEMSSDVPLTTLAMMAIHSSFTTMVMGEILSAYPEDQTHLSLSPSASSPMTLPGKITVIPQPSEAVMLTSTRTDATTVWPQTLPPSTPVALSVVTHMAEDMSSASLATDKTNLSFNSKVTGMAPLSFVTTLSPELTSTMAESSTDVPLTPTSPKAPIVSGITPVRTSQLSTSADSTLLGPTTHGVPYTDSEMSSNLPLTTLAMVVTASTDTAMVMGEVSSAPSGPSPEAQEHVVLPPGTSLGEISTSSEPRIPRETRPATQQPVMTTVTPANFGQGSSLAATTLAEPSETQRALVTKVPQASDTISPLSPIEVEITGTGTMTASTLASGLGSIQVSMDTVPGSEANKTSFTSSSFLESPRTQATHPERVTSSSLALSSLSTEESLRADTASPASVSTVLSEVTAPRANAQGSENESTATLEVSTAPAVETSPAVTLIPPWSKATALISMGMETMSSSAVSSPVKTSSPRVADITSGELFLEPSTKAATASPVHDSLSLSSYISPTLTTSTVLRSSSPTGTAPSWEGSGTVTLTAGSVETSTLAVTLSPARIQAAWTSSPPTPASPALEGSSARAETASVSAPVPTSSTLFTNGLGSVTHIPDHGVPGGTATLTSGPLAPVSTVSAPGFSTRSTVTLDSVSGSDLERDSAESTSIPMTGSTVRDSISDTATEIVIMETTRSSTTIQAPPSHCGFCNRLSQA